MPTNTFFNLPREKKEKIINAAKSEFVEYSFHDASINRIIKNAGISRGSFYMYFENKEDLFLYILDGYREEALAEIVSNLNGEKCDIFQMGIYIYDHVTSKDFNKEMYEFIIKTVHKVDVNLLNYFFRLDCRDVKINSAKNYTDVSKIAFTNDEELLNILEVVENTMITELIAVLSGKYACSVGKEKLLSKFNIIKNGVSK